MRRELYLEKSEAKDYSLFYCCLVAKSCLSRHHVECRPPGSCIHGISQARILKWVAISFSRESFWLRNRTHISCIFKWILYHWDTKEAIPCVKFVHFMLLYCWYKAINLTKFCAISECFAASLHSAKLLSTI